MRRLLVVALAVAACWNPADDLQACVASGRCLAASDAGSTGGAGGTAGGSAGGAAGGTAGGSAGGTAGGSGGGSAGGTAGGGGGGSAGGTAGSGGGSAGGTAGSGGGSAGGGTGGGAPSDAGEPNCFIAGRWEWPCVAAELAASEDAGSALLIPRVTRVPAPNAGASSARWAGAVFTTTGEVACVPFDATAFLVISPDGGVRLGDPKGNTIRYLGGVVRPDGLVYAIPHETTGSVFLAQFDPATGATSTFLATTAGGTAVSTAHQCGAVVDTYGTLWMIPSESDTIRAITVDAGQRAYPAPGARNWCAGGLLPNGNVVGIPTYLADAFLEIVPYADGGAFVDTHPVQAGGGHWATSVIGTNGRLYGVPTGFTDSVEIGPGFTQTQKNVNQGKFAGGAHAPEGRIVFTPESYEAVVAWNPQTTLSSIADAGGGAVIEAWFGAATGIDGRIYVCPHNSPDVLIIDTQPRRPLPKTVLLSPWLNHP